MITKTIAVAAGDKWGQTTFYHLTKRNADGTAVRCRTNSKCKVWKTRPDDFRLPVKYGLKDCFYITPRNAAEWSLTDPTAVEEPTPKPTKVTAVSYTETPHKWRGLKNGVPHHNGMPTASAAASAIEDNLGVFTLDWQWNAQLTIATADYNGNRYEIRRTTPDHSSSIIRSTDCDPAREAERDARDIEESILPPECLDDEIDLGYLSDLAAMSRHDCSEAEVREAGEH